MGKNFQGSSLILILLSGTASLFLNTACEPGGSKQSRPPGTSAQADASKGEKNPLPATSGAKDTKANEDILNLAQSEWGRCIELTRRSDDVGKGAVYELEKFNFSDSTSVNGKLVYELKSGGLAYFASDEKCKAKISAAQASQILGRDLTLATELFKVKLEVGNETGISGVYEVDMTVDGEKTYRLAKISAQTYEITTPCWQDAIREKLCTKFDGDRPDNRAKTWDIYKDGSSVLTRVK